MRRRVFLAGIGAALVRHFAKILFLLARVGCGVRFEEVIE